MASAVILADATAARLHTGAAAIPNGQSALPQFAQANADLATIQDALNRVGLKGGTPTGARSRGSLDAVRSFQAMIGAQSTGVLTAAQRAELMRRAGRSGVATSARPTPRPVRAATALDPADAAPARLPVSRPIPAPPAKTAPVTTGSLLGNYRALSERFQKIMDAGAAEDIYLTSADIDTRGGVHLVITARLHPGQPGPAAQQLPDGETLDGTAHNLAALIDAREDQVSHLVFLQPAPAEPVVLRTHRHPSADVARTWAQTTQDNLDALAVATGRAEADPFAAVKPFRRARGTAGAL